MTPEMPEVKVMFLDEEARKFGVPIYAYEGDAGVDLKLVLDKDEREHGTTVYPGERKLLPCGLAMEIEKGWWGRITHRSSTERRLRLRVVEGTIDNHYHGPIFVQVSNQNSFPVHIAHGDRLAQMIFHRRNQVRFVVVDQLSGSERGEKGFGSSGFKAQK